MFLQDRGEGSEMIPRITLLPGTRAGSTDIKPAPALGGGALTENWKRPPFTHLFTHRDVYTFGGLGSSGLPAPSKNSAGFR